MRESAPRDRNESPQTKLLASCQRPRDARPERSEEMQNSEQNKKQEIKKGPDACEKSERDKANKTF